MICAPLMAESVEQMLSDMHQAKMDGADVVEIRLGCISDFQPHRDLKLLLENKPLPVVVVYGPTWEAGEYEGDEQERLQALLLAKDLGADYIELELKVASAFMKEDKLGRLNSSKIIVSCYLDSLASFREDFHCLIAEMRSMNADIIKFVSVFIDMINLVFYDLKGQSWNRVFAIAFTFVVGIRCKRSCTMIAYCTGERGLISQLLSFKFGGVFAYGSLEGTAICGLPSIDSLRQAYGVKNIDKNTVVFGLLSKPVSHSKGPILYNPAFRHVCYNGIYVPMLVDDLKAFFTVYTSSDFAGFSVGIPYKEAVIDFCDEVHPLAQSIGAVNTIVRRPDDGKLVGHNTDCEAGITAIEDALKHRNAQFGSVKSFATSEEVVCACGCWSAGRALALVLKPGGHGLSSLTLILVEYYYSESFSNSHFIMYHFCSQIPDGFYSQPIYMSVLFNRAKSLAAAVSGKALPFEDLIGFRPEKEAILANATPLGMHPNMDRIPVPEETLRDYKLVFDAVYTPRKTRLLKEAEAAGAIVVSGVEMFLRQATAQFSLFTGHKGKVKGDLELYELQIELQGCEDETLQSYPVMDEDAESDPKVVRSGPMEE
ncbi:Bifunctional 3-dehydroquinate dehydratase/shikimate dehydrogenase, chloroplastic [Sesamum angolense]|uniref:Bifunctional 3-dehydroquinate dehydratase/shikimate dehydrogenase, chloroplastic n=1 Tax=Sesamum angolense TaxID=2727404 RepID=A0AAE1XFF6_9LAMI|nr:Bifunctional 3-dehydroquinate dehydratase/shikimate dehydrogenase, chloroplastic [Sesamum angolense]